MRKRLGLPLFLSKLSSRLGEASRWRSSAYDAVSKGAERYGAKVEYSIGRAEFIGTQQAEGTDREQRDAARIAYEEIVGRSEVRGVQGVLESARDRWGEALGVDQPLTDLPLSTFGRWESGLGAPLSDKQQAKITELAKSTPGLSKVLPYLSSDEGARLAVFFAFF